MHRRSSSCANPRNAVNGQWERLVGFDVTVLWITLGPPVAPVRIRGIESVVFARVVSVTTGSHTTCFGMDVLRNRIPPYRHPAAQDDYLGLLSTNPTPVSIPYDPQWCSQAMGWFDSIGSNIQLRAARDLKPPCSTCTQHDYPNYSCPGLDITNHVNLMPAEADGID